MSNSLDRLQKRLGDADRLIEIHEECTGPDRGRRYGYDVLNRSTVVLTVAAWESFVEDFLSASVRKLLRRWRDSQEVPAGVRSALLFHVHEQHKMSKPSDATKAAIWRFTGHGWRTEYLQWRLGKIRRLNTPNHENIVKYYSQVIGLPDVSASWGGGRWPQAGYTEKLNTILDLRHDIAHGTIGDEAVKKSRARNGIKLVKNLAKWTRDSINRHCNGFNLLGTPIRLRPPAD